MATNDKEDLLHVLEIETSRISNLDSTIFTIKGWTITLVSALVGFAFTTASSSGFLLDRALLLLATGATVIFMLIDIHFRSVQLRHVRTEIEIKDLLIDLSKDQTDIEKHTIWERLWPNLAEGKKKRSNNFPSLYQGYFFTTLPYIIIIVGLAYLVL